MTVCDELHEKLKQLGCTPKSGTTLREARGLHQSVSGSTLKRCLEQWLVQGEAEPCGECPCEGIRATHRNNPHPETQPADLLTFPFKVVDALVSTVDKELKAVDEALMYYDQASERKGVRRKPIRTRLKTRPTIVSKLAS